jgi:hypothetical protein
MHYLLLMGAFIFFAFMAPVGTTVAFLAVLLFVSAAVKASAHSMAHVSVTLLQSLRAVAYALLFVLLWMFTLGSFSIGTGISQFTLAGSLASAVAFFLACFLGFHSEPRWPPAP